MNAEYEWVPDETFTTDEAVIGGKTCSFPRCRRPAVAAFWRTYYAIGTHRIVRKRIQRCCEEHMYGRRLQNGRVEIKVRVGSPYWEAAKAAQEATK